MAYSFLFGGNTGETPETLKRKRELAMAIMGAQGAPKTVGEGLTALGAGITAGIVNRRADKAENAGRAEADALFNSGMRGQLAAKISGSTPSVTPAGGQGSVASGPVTTSGDVYSPFMDTVKTGISNPYGLAAVAATANAESRFSPKNANRAWSDPSESGKAGTAGGIMSWRDDRLNNLYAFAGQKGEKQGAISPTTQGEFFLQENPQLVAALNNAKSVEEAQQLMNEAWKFAGWNRPGGEAASRMASANAYLPNFQGQPQPREVASLDPSIGMPETSAGAVTAMGQGNFPQPVNPQTEARAGSGVTASASPFAPPQSSLSDEVAAYEQTPEYAARFPGRQQGASQSAPVEVAQAQPSPEQDPDTATLYQIITHPFTSPEQKAVAKMMLEQQMKRSDPAYQMGLEKSRLDLDAARSGEWSKLDDGRLYNQRTGEVRNAPTNPNAPPSDLGLNPQYGVDERGNPVLLQLGKDGKVVRSSLPEGVTLSKEPIRLDAGTHFVLLDPITRQPVGQVPKNLAEAESQKAQGTAQGKAQAETQSEYDSITSKMPGLYSVVDRLDKLSDQATYTLAGQGVDFVRKELGMSPRDAAVARAEYTAVVDNQILPLLRDTFGAQFTAEEGQRLARTLGDPDKSPTEKQALLRAFIQQKERDINALSTRLGAAPTGGQGGNKSTTIGGYTIEEE